jgi:hypothetical protein
LTGGVRGGEGIYRSTAMNDPYLDYITALDDRSRSEEVMREWFEDAAEVREP